MARALEHPESFVIKPQREGGGNNIYGEAVADALREMSASERQAHILMERIRPRSLPCTMVRGDTCVTVPAVSELGIFAMFLGDGAVERLNETAGHLVRTKSEMSDEGGIAAGFAVADSPLVIL